MATGIGGMGKGGSAPAPVDYEKLIPQQVAANKDIFDYSLGQSRVNTVTPFGQSTWSQTSTPDTAAYEKALSDWTTKNSAGGTSSKQWVPGTSGEVIGYNESGPVYGSGGGTDGYWQDVPGAAAASAGAAPSLADFAKTQWTQTQTLSPEQQKLYDADVASKLGLADLTQSAMGGVASSMAGALPSDSEYNQQLADAIYSQQTRYLDPQQKDLASALETRLGEMGFSPGTPAWNNEMSRFDRSNDLVYGDARDRAIAGGYKQGQQSFENALRLRALPLSELNALRTGAQPTIPGNNLQQTSVPGLAPVDLLGAANQQYQQGMDVYNAGVGTQNNFMQVLAQIAAAALQGGSDPRLKTDVVRVGTTPGGVPVYEWTYIVGGPRYRGVMAPDVPYAASRGADGFWRVDYSKVR